MSLPTATVFFENTAGQVLAHPAGYGVLRYRSARRQPTDIADLLSSLGRMLLAHGWNRFLADNRQMTALNEAEKNWFATKWLGQGGQHVPRPAPLYGAVVLPTEVIARLAITQMLNEADAATMVYRTFTEEAAATAYLAGLPTPRR